MNTLYLIRGLPGSGKTTLANRLTGSVFEADQYFVHPDSCQCETCGAHGTGYHYDPTLLSLAHGQCQGNVQTAMLCDTPVIAVANTFTQQWEMAPYRALAQTYGYTVIEVTMSGPVHPNVHGVSSAVIQTMRDRWEVS